jgi:glutamate formiminotransferase/formiminotetrahydrofolate cyclodeaminase
MKLVECVPNFSEGRDRKVLDAIAAAVESVEGVKLLDVDPGAATNRTVFTFVGRVDTIVDAAFAAIRKGAELIDMSKHSGAHARQGACDVCPFIPLGETTMEECVELSRELARRVGEELQVPVYLYEYAATRPERKSIVDIRVGEYEALPEKLKDPAFAPDFGPATFNPRFGAMVTGAREFLIAYNINLNTRNKKIAKDIALDIRDKGRFARDDKGKKIIGENGKAKKVPGMFKNCKATGWFIEEYGVAQVTMNLTNYKVTPPHAVFDAVCRLADERGVRVTGSEIVGLVPLEVMRQAGLHYLHKQGATRGVSEAELVDIAIKSMGFSEVAPFDPQKKIIEYQIADRDRGLMGMTCNGFVDELSSDSPAPGGGSVAALCGSMSAALTSMVATLSFSKKGFKKLKPEMDEVGQQAQALKDFFARAVDDDTDSFNRVMDAMRLPKGTEAEQAARHAAIQAATKGAVDVPFSVLERSLDAARLSGVMVEKGNPNSLSDAGVASLCARLAARGAYYNVLINLPGVEDGAYVQARRTRAAELLAETAAVCDTIDAAVEARLLADLGPRRDDDGSDEGGSES